VRSAVARGLFLTLLLFGACSERKPAAPPAPPAVPVIVATAARKDVPIELRSIGNVQAFSSVEIRSRVGGELTQVGFKEGDLVRKGQLLFAIDARPYRAALEQAEAQLARDSAVMKNAEADAARYADLVQKDYVTRQQYDAAVTAAAAGKQTVRADEALVENARLNLGYCAITAPITGRVGSLLVHPGNIVKANDDPLVLLLQIQPVYVAFSVPERDLPEIRRRMAEESRGGEPLPVSAAESGGGAEVGRGHLTFVDNSVDVTTGTIQLKALFENEDRALWPGQFVDVVLRLGEQKGAVVVPGPAVQTGQDGQFVFVVKPDQTVESRPVDVARSLGEETVIGKGLAPGETVVTDGQLRLVPGARVQIKQAVREGAGAPRSCTPPRPSSGARSRPRSSRWRSCCSGSWPTGSCRSATCRTWTSRRCRSTPACRGPARRRWPPRSRPRSSASSPRSPDWTR